MCHRGNLPRFQEPLQLEKGLGGQICEVFKGKKEGRNVNGNGVARVDASYQNGRGYEKDVDEEITRLGKSGGGEL